MSLNNKILEYLKTGKSITAIQALNYFGCFRLSARIYDLIKAGHNIKMEIVKRGKKHFAKYKLIKNG